MTTLLLLSCLLVFLTSPLYPEASARQHGNPERILCEIYIGGRT
ncbi:MAG: hypothetical protein QGH37_10095 [Candidatus Poribacteria bacterium]|nr:hypothetical protein [Candidatus Poribacteria bacterium]MDP6999212.1 hypothetical protein [Candidatus Poribacteria bacterium]